MLGLYVEHLDVLRQGAVGPAHVNGGSGSEKERKGYVLRRGLGRPPRGGGEKCGHRQSRRNASLAVACLGAIRPPVPTCCRTCLLASWRCCCCNRQARLLCLTQPTLGKLNSAYLYYPIIVPLMINPNNAEPDKAPPVTHVTHHATRHAGHGGVLQSRCLRPDPTRFGFRLLDPACYC